MQQDWINALMGGVLIGIAVSLMLFLNGRATGISGIINGIILPIKGDKLWRLLFIAGLFSGGLALNGLNPKIFSGALNSETWTIIVAGLLVGFGTIMGSGCTSGHGICGLSRVSVRSLVTTVTFIIAGIIAVFIFRKLGLSI